MVERISIKREFMRSLRQPSSGRISMTTVTQDKYILIKKMMDDEMDRLDRYLDWYFYIYLEGLDG